MLSLIAGQGGGEDAAAGPGKTVSVSTSRTADGRAEALDGSNSITVSASKAVARSGSSKAAAPVRKERLADGSTAEIHKIGAQHYRAKIVSRGDVLATIEANGDDAGLDANDMFIVLTPDGKVHSWLGGGHAGPGTFKLPGGWTAKVTKVGDLHYRAQILGRDGVVMGTLEADQQDDGGVANGIYMVLSTGGVISAHE